MTGTRTVRESRSTTTTTVRPLRLSSTSTVAVPVSPVVTNGGRGSAVSGSLGGAGASGAGSGVAGGGIGCGSAGAASDTVIGSPSGVSKLTRASETGSPCD